MKTVIRFVCAVIVSGLLTPFNTAAAAHPDQNDLPWERFNLTLGGFLTTLDSSVRLGGNQLGLGVDIDVEKTLGLETRTHMFRAGLMYRFSENRKHRMDLTYFDMRRRASKTLETEIEINDQVFPVGTEVNSLFNIRIFKASYSYSFFMDDRIDARTTAGLYMMPLRIEVASPDFGAEGTDFIAPLPTFGLGFSVAITEDVLLQQSLEMFYLEIDNYKGLMTDMSILLEYHCWKNVGIGGGINIFRLSVESLEEDYPNIDLVGSIDFGYSGVLLYGKYYFN